MASSKYNSLSLEPVATLILNPFYFTVMDINISNPAVKINLATCIKYSLAHSGNNGRKFVCSYMGVTVD